MRVEVNSLEHVSTTTYMVKLTNQFAATLPRAFVLRYGLAQVSRHHERGEILSIAFQIQTPWILLHQTVREVVLDYVEDYVNGTVWSNGLIRSRFKMDFEKAMHMRNRIIERIQSQPTYFVSRKTTRATLDRYGDRDVHHVHPTSRTPESTCRRIYQTD